MMGVLWALAAGASIEIRNNGPIRVERFRIVGLPVQVSLDVFLILEERVCIARFRRRLAGELEWVC